MRTRQGTITGAAVALLALAVGTGGRLPADEAEDKAAKAIRKLGGTLLTNCWLPGRRAKTTN
jgi:hypothetical protein